MKPSKALNSKSSQWCVIKRDGREEPIQFDKISRRIEILARMDPPLNHVNVPEITQKVVQGVHDKVLTSDLDKLAAETAAYMSTCHPEYSDLAARIAISDLQKNTSDDIMEVFAQELNYIHPRTKTHAPLISKEVYDIIEKNKEKILERIDYSNDFNYDYFGFKTLERGYLAQCNGKVIERPTHMLIRVVFGIHKNDVDAALNSYEYMSKMMFTFATPTLFNSGTNRPQMSSCFLLTMIDDSIKGIYETLKRCALISKNAGGIGLSVHKIRSNGSYIRGANGGGSNGLVPMLKVFNDTARYVDQCFSPGTIIHTMDGPTCIEKIKIGDRLLTHTGKMQPVDKVLQHDYEGPILRISTEYGVEDVAITPQHQILALKNQRNESDRTMILIRLSQGYIKPQMIDADDLNVGDFVCFPAPNGDDDAVDMSNLGCDDLRFYGMLLANGRIQNSTSHSTYSISVKIFERRESVCEFLEDYLCRANIKVYTKTPDEDNKAITYRWSVDHSKFKFRLDQFYDIEEDKKVWPSFFRLPVKKQWAIIQGIFGSNGRDEKQYILQLCSKRLVHEIRHILLRCGVLSVGLVNDQKEFKDSENSYSLRIPIDPQMFDLFSDELDKMDTDFLKYDGMMYSRITNINEDRYTGKVYDFEVCKNHTYVSEVGTVHNGGGKRKGAFAIYLEPWHPDIFEFLDLKKNTGKEEDRARDLFYGLWIPDLFMKRVEAGEKWSLFCPDEAHGLADCWGKDFEELYCKYEREGKAKKTVPAQNLWYSIVQSQIETGTPYLLYKDSCNAKSNQKNLGTIRSSNLCTEIVEYTSPDEVAVCNLASMGLPKFVKETEDKKLRNRFDFVCFMQVVRHVVSALNCVIDENCYPIDEAKRSNMRHRPVGLGVQGLADTFILMRQQWDSEDAKILNKHIFAAMYYAALDQSCKLAEIHGHYETFPGSPASEGILQFDMWNVAPVSDVTKFDVHCGEKPIVLDWTSLKERIKKFGLRNSLLIAPMPTASTSQILGNNECFEPYTSNVYTRRTNAGDFTVVNKHLIRDLSNIDLWNDDMKDLLIAHKGSIQNISCIPDHLKPLYKTTWEIKQRILIDMAADRGAYIDQSQSLNIFMSGPDYGKVTSAHFYTWKTGLKGTYYLRTKAAADPIAFTVDREKLEKIKKRIEKGKEKAPVNYSGEILRCGLQDGCLSCSS